MNKYYLRNSIAVKLTPKTIEKTDRAKVQQTARVWSAAFAGEEFQAAGHDVERAGR